MLAVLAAGAEENHGFYISNHDQSPTHRVIHPIVGQTNFVYDAKGALRVASPELGLNRSAQSDIILGNGKD